MVKRTEAGQQRERERKNAYARDAAQSTRDIGPIPAVANPRRRKRCERDLLAFCLKYFPQRFLLAFSDDHKAVIASLQRCILAGGQFALAMPRGSGKTTLCEVAVIFALVYGHRRFVVLIGASASHAQEMLDSIKGELESNEDLQADFPEICFPITALDRIANRAKGQLCEGEPTNIKFAQKVVTVATIAGSKASGATVRIAGITGRIRGMKHTTSDGTSIRPDLVILDDPQTDESAASKSQNQKREKTVSGAVLGLAGPGQKIAAIMPCTVIEPGDMADRILDRERHPEWNGVRCKLLYELPKNEALWEEYDRRRREGLRAGRGLADATAYYRANRVEMDAGARPAWPERFNPDELSAIQHAMTLKLTDERAFRAEYQNDPIPLQGDDEVQPLVAEAIAGRLSRLPRYELPPETTRVTAMIDVGGSILYYAITAWDERFSGYVIDYGTWPRQRRAYFKSTDASPSLQTLYPGVSEEAAIYRGLTDLAGEILGRSYPRPGSDQSLRIERCLVDCNWASDTVHQFIRQSPYGPILLGSVGKGINAGGKSMDEWKLETGDRRGLNWIVNARPRRRITMDVNWWKSFVAARLQTPAGAGSLWFFGDQSHAHQLFADHCLAEYRVRTRRLTGAQRIVDQWSQHPQKPDNHWWDCLIGCAVAVSERGLAWLATGDAAPPPPKKRIKLSEVQAQKAGRAKPRR